MYVLVRRYGETSWTAALLPVSVDGMIAASSMTLLADSRHGQRSGILPWILLIVGSMASLSVNVAVAEPSAVGRLIAAWPSAALIGSYELLMRQVRHAATRERSLVLREMPHTSPADDMGSYVSHANSANDDVGSYEIYTAPADPPAASYDAQSDSHEALLRNTDEVRPRGRGGTGRSRPRRSASKLQHDAWQWAIVNRTPAGDLPSGKAIAERFGRRERWGRLVKQA